MTEEKRTMDLLSIIQSGLEGRGQGPTLELSKEDKERLSGIGLDDDDSATDIR